MKKIILSIFALCATTSLWAYDFQSGDLYYNITSDATVEVCQQAWSESNYSGLTSATIPSTVTYNGTTYSVTSIGSEAFSGCSSLTSVTIPNSVTSIGGGAFSGTNIYNDEANWENGVLYINDCLISAKKSISGAYTIKAGTRIIAGSAFYNCSSLTSITIPNSVTNIGSGEYKYGFWEGIFSGCSSLKSIIVQDGNPVYDSRNNCNAIVETATNTLVVGCQGTNMPSSITSIGPGAFAGHENLTSIYMPASITNIGHAAFQNCSALTSITIPNSVTSIGSNTFQNCNSLKSITIPNSVTSIGSDAFAFCESLKEVILPNNITSIEYYTFYGCSSLTSVTIPSSVTSIGDRAFYNCEKLGTLVLGDKVKEIGDYAFEECNKLYHIYCYAPEPPVMEENVFTNYNVNLYVPCNYLDSYKYDRVFGSFRYIQCVESEDVTTDDVVVTPGTNDVTFTWPTETGADTYTIVIQKGNEVFCTLTFNADGQLLNIAFAPGRNGNHPAQYAEQAGNGYRFTVTSLESGTKYGYNIDVKDASNKTIKSHSGEFTTQSTTAIEEVEVSDNANVQKTIHDGQLLILRNGKSYNVMGQEL